MGISILIFSLSSLIHAQDNEKRWKKLINLVEGEIRVIEQIQKKDFSLNHRTLELYTEKLKLINKKNNAEFLNQNSARKIKKNKEDYFSETRNFYFITKNLGLSILSQGVTSQQKAEIYFILALNSRDYGRDQLIEKYLTLVTKQKDLNNTAIFHHAETALAEFYYNEKKYSKAISYYKKIIDKKNDPWITKHLLNLSWCYFKSQKHDLALQTMKSAFDLSKNNIYVDVRDQVLTHVGVFYIHSNQVLKGASFLNENLNMPVTHLVSFAKKASEKGYENESLIVLKNAENLNKTNPTLKQQEEILHAYLDIFRTYGRLNEYEKKVKELTSFYVDIDIEVGKKLRKPIISSMKDEAIEKVRSVAGFLQSKVSGGIKKNERNYNQTDIKILTNLFHHLKVLDPPRELEYSYFEAETYSSLNEFKDASAKYEKLIIQAKQQKNWDIFNKSLNSLFSLTSMEVLGEDLNNSLLIFSYTQFLEYSPKDHKAEIIYPKLFALYMNGVQHHKAKAVVVDFNKFFPSRTEQQQTMLLQLFDLLISNKKINEISMLLEDLKSGFLSFSKQKITEMETNFGYFQLNEFKKLSQSGLLLDVLVGFESISKQLNFSEQVRAKASLEASLTHLEMGSTEKAFEWLLISYQFMSFDEKITRRAEDLKIAERFYKLQDFLSSTKLSQYHLDNFCDKADQIQSRFYQIAVMTTLAEGAVNKTQDFIYKYSSCLKDEISVKKAKRQVLNFLIKKIDLRGLKDFISNETNPEFILEYASVLKNCFWEQSDSKIRQSCLAELKVLNNPEAITLAYEIETYMKASIELSDFKLRKIWANEKFNQDAFNKSLEIYLYEVKKIKDKYDHLFKSNQSEIVFLTTQLFSDLYLTASNNLISLKPLGMEEELVESFTNAMKKIAEKLNQTSLQYNKSYKKMKLQHDFLPIISSVNSQDFSYSTHNQFNNFLIMQLKME